MTISAKIIKHSITSFNEEIITFELRYPRFIHAEFMTHREFSRNASSSRAIPIEKQIAMIKEDTAMPMHWGAAQSGMQADNETNNPVMVSQLYKNHAETLQNFSSPMESQDAWLYARDQAVKVAESFLEAGYHKQVVNRLLEPFSHISVIMTTSYLSNFFALRSHKDAQPEIRILSDLMKAEYEASKPTLLAKDDWHLPYTTFEDITLIKDYITSDSALRVLSMIEQFDDILIKISVARCARVSYLTHDGRTPSIKNDLNLYDRLVGSVPLHASPTEHQARAITQNEYNLGLNLSGNLAPHLVQYRKLLTGEYQS